MASPIGSVGTKSNIGQLTAVDQSFDTFGHQVVVPGGGDYSDLVLRGKVWMAANQAGAAITNLNATATGLILTNPVGSGVYARILHLGLLQTSTAAAAANAGVQLAIGLYSATAVTHTTPLTVRNALVIQSPPTGAQCLVDSSATIPAAPVAVMNLWQPSVSATATTGIPPVPVFELKGLVIIGPGCTVSLSALGTLSGAGHIYWEEIPIPTSYS